MKTLTLLLLLWCGCPVFAAEEVLGVSLGTPPAPALGPWEPGQSPSDQLLDRIALAVKSAVQGLSAGEVRERMARRYRILRLLDEQGGWRIPELAARSSLLLPEDLDGAALARFVDRMADVARGN